MAQPLVALGIQNPKINALGAFSEGREAQMKANRFNREEAEATMETIGSMALGVMGGDINGTPNPQRWEQALNMLASKGFDVEEYRGRSDLAPVVARASLDTMDQMRLAQNDRDYELALKQFEASVANQRESRALQRQRLAFDMARTNQPGAPDLETLYDTETGLPYKAAWNPETGQFDRVGGVKAPSGTQMRLNPETGEFEFQQGSGLKPLTEGQSKDTVFATRAAGALPTINELGDALTSAPENIAERMPGGNYVVSEDYQKASQAGKEFLQAILRKDTGAAITAEETAEYGSVYLPRPGDKPGTLDQKKQSRQRALDALRAGMPPQAILAQEKALGNANIEAAKPVEKRIKFNLETGEWEE